MLKLLYYKIKVACVRKNSVPTDRAKAKVEWVQRFNSRAVAPSLDLFLMKVCFVEVVYFSDQIKSENVCMFKIITFLELIGSTEPETYLRKHNFFQKCG